MPFVQYVVVVALVAVVGAGTVSAQEKAAPPKPPASQPENQSVLRARAKLKEPQARKIALDEAQGTVRKYELKRQGKNLVYVYTIKLRNRVGLEEVYIDAMTGRIVEVEHDAPGARRR